MTANILGLPPEMALVFLATIFAGSLGAIHYLIFHIILRHPFPDELEPVPFTQAGSESEGVEGETKIVEVE